MKKSDSDMEFGSTAVELGHTKTSIERPQMSPEEQDGPLDVKKTRRFYGTHKTISAVGE